MSQYLFDNAADQAPARFSVLETCYDHVTRDNLTRLGVRSGWNCLEVGGGGGSLGAWLADTVGPEGRVLLTDIAPQTARCHERANLTVEQHDIVHDELPESEFDLIHARLVLLHLPQRREVLDRLITALKPGGWLVLEEFDCEWTPVLAASDPGAISLFEKVHSRLMHLLINAGADLVWARKAHAAMSEAGLEEVSSTTYAESWTGGGVGTRLHRVNSEQVEAQLIDGGVAPEELRAFWSLLEDPRFVVNSYPLVNTRGCRRR
ncbi:class I SAM-dependent methyltransferase [Saccharopolyspora pogona]|uniref:class I SAM-dependent methyltransferase n=1 Tax=Saccharopolyspora pogona TaxID=333966 RepID=UPI0016841D51|nr:methyltransferase domain-containing protein [Saccharopolyspora pogona]